MVDRRQLLRNAVFGGFVARPGISAEQSLPERQAQERPDFVPSHIGTPYENRG